MSERARQHAAHLQPRKPRLAPPYAVFPEPSPYVAPTPATPTSPASDLPSTPTQTSSTASSALAYDYFNWHAQSTVPADISTPAPVCGHDDDFHAAHDAHLGAWYSIARGFSTPLGDRYFPEQLAVTRRARRRTRTTARRARVYADASAAASTDPAQSRDAPASHDADAQARSSQVGNFVDRLSLNTLSNASSSSLHPMDEDSESSISDDDSSTASVSDSDDNCEKYTGDRFVRYNIAHNMTPYTSVVSSASQEPLHDSEAEITAEHAANGTDIQGIPWGSLTFSREDYRATRLREHSRRDSQESIEGLRDLVKEPRKGARFYNFFRNTRRVKCTIVHFQLRNLAWATSKHDVFVMHDAAVVHWDAAAKRKNQVLDLSGSSTAVASGLGMVQISTMIAKNELVIAGGFYGEMVAKNLKSGTIIHNKRITYDENAITNAIDIFENSIMTSNNDCYVRCFDMSTFKQRASFQFSSAVNHATRQPEGKMVAVAGDENQIQVIDGDSGDRIAQLHGHEHYSFATGWHPGGRMFATGSQDRTCRVWDVRNMSRSLSVLGAHTGAVRSLRFSSCGRFLVIAEPLDFVHIFDVNRGEFDTCQEVDLFGEIAGIALTPSAEALYIAVSDRTYSSLIEYERKTSSMKSEMIF